MDASFHIRPFAFDREFAPPARARASAKGIELELELDALRAELEALRRDHNAELARARADGFEAGLQQARGERETAVLAAVDALQASVETMEAELSQATASITRDAAGLALAAADVIAARALDHAPEAAIDEALGRLLEQLGRGPQLLIRVHSQIAPDMEKLVELRTARERRRMSLSVIADDGIAIGDAVMIWDEGSLVLDAAARRAAVLEELAPLLGD